ncbi:MAG TPA: hypothetical protein VGB17_15440 [Pyrinomonadaceae bacterium]|jgi:hypothetical protein
MPHPKEEVQAKYICLDIEDYTKERPVEAQLEILAALNEIVKNSVKEELNPKIDENSPPEEKKSLMYLPTGDGMCIALLNVPSPFDIHLLLALRILKGVSEHNSRNVSKSLRFEVRVGIHAHTDSLVVDINGDQNIVGAGINTAFRIMGLADGRQILVSQDVFNQLKNHLKYEDSFIPLKATVRHGAELEVYQFKGEGLGLEVNAAPQIIEKQAQATRIYESIIEPGTGLGLEKVYRSRDEGVALDVRNDMEGAQARIWLLGVALHSSFNITEPGIMRLLNNKMASGVEVRILLLDAFRSPAVFRALLESSCEEFGRIINYNRREPRRQDPFFENQLYINFEANYLRMANWLNSQVAVRYYAHVPSCWLAIIDNKVYYQAYTFGDVSDDPRSHLIGSQMPVVKLQGETTPCCILRDHFNKLWLTSDTDLFIMGSRIAARELALWDTFEKRKESKWFEHIYGVLCNEKSPGQDRRIYARQRCLSSLRLGASVTWANGEKTKAKILNFSRQGALLSLELGIGSELFTSLPDYYEDIEEEIIVKLEIEPEGGWGTNRDKRLGIPNNSAAKYLVDGVLQSSEGKFKYIRKETRKFKEQNRPCVALQSHRK